MEHLCNSVEISLSKQLKLKTDLATWYMNIYAHSVYEIILFNMFNIYILVIGRVSKILYSER